MTSSDQTPHGRAAAARDRYNAGQCSRTAAVAAIMAALGITEAQADALLNGQGPAEGATAR